MSSEFEPNLFNPNMWWARQSGRCARAGRDIKKEASPNYTNRGLPAGVDGVVPPELVGPGLLGLGRGLLGLLLLGLGGLLRLGRRRLVVLPGRPAPAGGPGGLLGGVVGLLAGLVAVELGQAPGVALGAPLGGARRRLPGAVGAVPGGDL